MRKILHLFTLFIILFLPLACKPAGPVAVTDLRITIKEGSMTSSTQRMIAGASITITTINSTHETIKVWLLSTPVVINAEIDPNLIIYQAQVSAGQAMSGIFTAPKAAGEYPIMYSQVEHQEISGVIKVVFVQPEYAH